MSITDIESIADVAVECGFQIHRDLGPGLMESVYEALLAASIAGAGLAVERQRPVDVEYRGICLREAFRADLLIGGRLVIEVKSIERVAAVHTRQVLTYLKLLDLPLGLPAGWKGAPARSG